MQSREPPAMTASSSLQLQLLPAGAFHPSKSTAVFIKLMCRYGSMPFHADDFLATYMCGPLVLVSLLMSYAHDMLCRMHHGLCHRVIDKLLMLLCRIAGP